MSLYNMLFGKNPASELLLALLGTTEKDVPRFRDCYLDDKGRIVVHTRTGGGNRDFYESEELCRDSFPEYFDGRDDPKGPWNSDLRKLPGFLYDRDDDFDCTYADFLFAVQPEHREVVALISEHSEKRNPKEAWQELFKDLQRGDESNPAVARALTVGKMVLAQINEKSAP